MQVLGNAAAGFIDFRAFDQGLGLNDRPHKTYTEITGKTGFGAYSKGWGLVRAGLRNPPAEYGTTRSQASRKTSEIDLTFSGTMRRGLRAGRVTKFTVLVGVFGSAAERAHFTSKLRPWLGLSPKDRTKLIKEARRLIGAAK